MDAVRRFFRAAAVNTRQLVLRVLLLVMIAGPAQATWSILIVNTATGEVAIGIATCLTFFDLRPSTVVVVPGVGVAAAQSLVGPLSLRQLIRTELLNGTPPSQILTMLAAADPGFQFRQYGIADVSGGSATFTGTGAGPFAGGLTGQTGTLVYAIQGNVLTGLPVIQNAEQALISTPGDVGQKLMAAMEAARVMGGDGRCSCSSSNPPGCGAPPAAFTKSSHIGLMIVSRPGDLDAPCTSASGCGAGTYYMDLNVANQPASALDPVLQLQSQFNAWRAARVGRPDHFMSTVTFSPGQVLANGISMTTATVTLRDLQGNPVSSAPVVTATLEPGSTAAGTQVGPVVAAGSGVHTFTVTSGITPGQALVRVVATDAQGSVTLSPTPVVTVGDPFGACGAGTVDDGMGGVVDVLRIDGSAGVDRVVTVGFNQPFTVSLDPLPRHPAGGGLVGQFLLWVRAGVPTPADNLPLGPAIGTLCFSPPPLPVSAPTVLIGDTVTGAGIFPATPAPWSFNVPGIAAVLDLAVQGVVIETPTGEIGVTNALLLRVQLLAPPTIASVTPAVATAGTAVTLQGTGFQSGATVMVGPTPATLQSLGATSLVFTMPPGAGCDVSVTVTNPDSQSASITMNPTPLISNALFPSGPAAGGGLFFIQGQNLALATVTIGGVPATITAQGATFITLTAPPGTPGPATVIVMNAAGCMATTTYTYL